MRLKNNRFTSALGAAHFKREYLKIAISVAMLFPLHAQASVTLLSPAASETIATNKPEFVWQDQADATHFQVQVRDISNGNTNAKWWKRADVCDGSQCRSTVPGVDLEFSKNHWWRARVRTSDGWQAWTTPVSRFHYSDGPPGEILVNGPEGNTTDATPMFSWNHIEGVSTYRVWARDYVANESAIFANYKSADVCSNGVCEIDSDFEFASSNTTDHQWMIRAFNSGGWNAWSSRYKFRVQSQDNTAPTASINADSGDIKPGSVTITGAATDESGGSSVERVIVRIVRDDGYFYTSNGWEETSSWPWLYTNGLADWSYTLDLEPGTYSVTALARDAAGNQDWSKRSEESFTVEAEPVYKEQTVLPITVVGNEVRYGGVPRAYAGNSLFWSNTGWNADGFYNEDVVLWLKSDWNSKIIRAAMGVDSCENAAEVCGTYLDYRDANSKADNIRRVEAVVDAAIKHGVYVIIDWHSHHAEDTTAEAVEFFSSMAAKYKDDHNVIYEIYNEPIDTSWSDIRRYAVEVIDAIREHDSDNLIIVGTQTYSQRVDQVIENPLSEYDNIAYSLHFYADTHWKGLRDKAQEALDANLALFVTEWDSVAASGQGAVNENSTRLWINFLQTNNISHTNWAVNDKVWDYRAGAQRETSSVLVGDQDKFQYGEDDGIDNRAERNPTERNGGWNQSDLTASGKLARTLMKENNNCLDELSSTTRGNAECVTVSITNVIENLSCLDDDPNNPHDNPSDGYGWNENGSCSVSSGPEGPIDPNPVCVDTAPVGDGWGWDGSQSCQIEVTDPEPAPVCEDTPPVGDGWGWDGSSSCQIEVTDPEPAPVCEDTPPVGDGWGWDGSQSCQIEATSPVCEDTPPVGDGWGWDGAQSCRI